MLITSKELAQRLRVTQQTIRNWAREGRIPSVRVSKQTLRFDLEAVEVALGVKLEEERAGKG